MSQFVGVARDEVSARAQLPDEHRAAGAGRWRAWAMVLVGVGVLWRIARFWLNFPFWQDEAKRALNLLGRPLWDLHPPHFYDQLQPPVFIFATQLLRLALSSREWVFRLIPLVSGLAALFLFYRFVRRRIDPLAGTLATGLLAVSSVSIELSTEFKPYVVDLLLAVVYLILAYEMQEHPRRLRGPGLLMLVIPLGMGLSYANIFLVGSFSLIVLPGVYRRGSRAGKFLFVAANVVGLAVLYGVVHQASSDEFATATSAMREGWWARSFPPGAPGEFIVWLFRVHLGAMSAYPIKAYNLCATVLCGLTVVGVVRLMAVRNYRLLALLIGPFVLTFAAAVLQRYPYGGEARVAQHLLPGLLIFSGVGFAEVVRRLEEPCSWAGRWVPHTALALLLVCAGYGVGHDFRNPYYRDSGNLVYRLAARGAVAGFPSDTPLYAPNLESTSPTFLWYLAEHISHIYLNEWPDESAQGSDVLLEITADMHAPILADAGWTCQEIRPKDTATYPPQHDLIMRQRTGH